MRFFGLGKKTEDTRRVKPSRDIDTVITKYTARSDKKFDIKEPIDLIYLNHMRLLVRLIDDISARSELEKFFEQWPESARAEIANLPPLDKLKNADAIMAKRCETLVAKSSDMISKIEKDEHRLANWTTIDMGENYSSDIMETLQRVKKGLKAFQESMERFESAFKSKEGYFGRIAPSAINYEYEAEKVVKLIKSKVVNDLTSAKSFSRKATQQLSDWRNSAREKGIIPSPAELRVY